MLYGSCERNILYIIQMINKKMHQNPSILPSIYKCICQSVLHSHLFIQCNHYDCLVRGFFFFNQDWMQDFLGVGEGVCREIWKHLGPEETFVDRLKQVEDQHTCLVPHMGMNMNECRSLQVADLQNTINPTPPPPPPKKRKRILIL